MADARLARFESPSPQEKRCLRGSAALLTITEIAAQLGIAENTVRGYHGSAMRKVGARTTKEAARLFAAYETETAPSDLSGEIRRVDDPVPVWPMPDVPRAQGGSENSNRVREAPFASQPSAAWGDSIPVLFRFRGTGENRTSMLGIIVGRAIVLAAAFGLLVSGLRVLSWWIWWAVTSLQNLADRIF